MTLRDMSHIFRYRIKRVDEELPFCLEISQLQDQVNRNREREHAADHLALCRAKIEVNPPVVFRKAWEAIELIHLLVGEDRQTTGISGHAAALSASARSTLFARQAGGCLPMLRRRILQCNNRCRKQSAPCRDS